jgi:capsular exopolysaccharide synthesis family protein
MSGNNIVPYRDNGYKNEPDLGRLFQILKRRKYILLISMVLFLSFGVILNSVLKPYYVASVLLKKDKPEKKGDNKDEITELINLQSSDEVETEIELVKTWDVLDKVIKDLYLFLNIDYIAKPENQKAVINLGYIDYKRMFSPDTISTSEYPGFSEVKVKVNNKQLKYFVEKKTEGYNLYNAETNSFITSSMSGNFETEFIDFQIWWNAQPGSRVYFTSDSYFKTITSLRNSITIDQQAKTSLFEISEKASSPWSAQLIVNTLAEKFRETRIEQQKQTIKYSFDFIDKNLQDFQNKLKEAEDNLTSYKSSNQITDLEGTSQDLIRFLSNIEADKMKTDLDLTEFQNKNDKMSDEMKSKGYFDQTFLTPQGTDPANSPFSQLLKQLNDLELRRLDLLQKRTENHPEVVNIDEQIRKVKENLSAYNQNTLTSYNILINSLDKKKEKLNDMARKYQGKLQVLPSQENKLAGLVMQRDVYSKMYTLMLDKREEMRLAELSKLQDIIIVDSAHEPTEASFPKKTFNLAASLLLGIIFGFLGIIAAEIKNRKLLNLDDIEDEVRFPIYAIIPNYTKKLTRQIENSRTIENRFVTLMNDQDGYKESFRVLKNRLSEALQNKSKVVMFTSFEENTGKTTVVINLALSYAQSNKKVLLIDCDLRKASLSRIFDLHKESPGLITYLRGKSKLPYIYNKGLKSLFILPSGGIDDDSSDLLSSDRLQELFTYLTSFDFDYIIIDTPPVTRVVDTLILGRIVKDAVLVLRPEHTFKESVKWGLQELEQSQISILGTVLNAGDIEKSVFKNRYGYGYGYKYGYTDGKPKLLKE